MKPDRLLNGGLSTPLLHIKLKGGLILIVCERERELSREGNNDNVGNWASDLPYLLEPNAHIFQPNLVSKIRVRTEIEVHYNCQ